MIEKIAVNGHYVWVDKDALIKIGDVVYQVNFERTNHQLIKIENEHQANIANVKSGSFTKYKIIAASPELHIEDVPTYVRWLARKEFPKDGTQESGYLAGGYVIGYQAAEKELYTEDDLRKAIEMADYIDFNGWNYTEEEIIEHIKQSKK